LFKYFWRKDKDKMPRAGADHDMLRGRKETLDLRVMNALPSTIRGWYELSKKDRTAFFRALRHLESETVRKMLADQTALPPRGRLRTVEELSALPRTSWPSVNDLRARGRSDEYALQCMFAHRGFFAAPSQKFLWREFPTCCADEMPEGWADLLIFDTNLFRPSLVELKDADANDPLTGVVLETLSHWAFHVQHLTEFLEVLHLFDVQPVHAVPGIAIAAPEHYFTEAKRRNREPRGQEFGRALQWIADLHQHNVVSIEMYDIEDSWLQAVPNFNMKIRT
jgi:hypothetical protein